MTRTRTTAIYVAIFTVVMFVFYLFLAIAARRAPDVALLMAAVMAGYTALIAAISYASRAYIHRRAFTGKKQAAENMDTHQQRMVEIDLPYDAAFDLALDALKTLDEQPVPIPDTKLTFLPRLLRQQQLLRVYETNRASGIVRAGLRPRTLGITDVFDFSHITLRLEKVDDGTTRIHIDSQAKTLFELYDLGKNLHYVNQLALYLRRESQQQTAESRLSDAESSESDEAANTDTGKNQRKLQG